MYCLKYKNIGVFEFDPTTCHFKLLNYNFLPFNLLGMSHSYDMVKVFCTNRVMLYTRKHSSEILDYCNLDKSDCVDLCIKCKALSFTDNYWIDDCDNSIDWDTINIRENSFSQDISNVALTGNLSEDYLLDGHPIITGELTLKGTKAKACFKENDGVYLYKALSEKEIKAEVISHAIADALTLPAATYSSVAYNGIECSKCKLMTDVNYDLIPCRDLLSYYKCDMGIGTCCYDFFLRSDYRNFILMQVFDFLTLNTDRNRDNFGLLLHKRSDFSMCPIFDHDSCFKGKSVNAFYFVTGMSFYYTIKHLLPMLRTPEFKTTLFKAHDILTQDRFKNYFLSLLDKNAYQGMLDRLDFLLQSL